jgi:hypothetical protein
MKEMRIAAWLGVGAVGAVAALACSSNHGGGNPNGAAASCFDQMSGGAGNDPCSACLDDHCSAQQNAVVTQCAPLFDCVCPTGTYEDGLLSQCIQTTDAPNCPGAFDDLNACSSPSCDSECAAVGLFEGGLLGDGGDGAPVGDGALTTVSCLFDSEGQCTQQQVPASGVYAAQADCVQNQHGVSGSGCPTEGLAGCCTDPGSDVETCFYGGDGTPDAASDEAACTSVGGGVWHASP